MIEVEVSEAQEPKESEYPKLMKRCDNDLVVLFTSENDGVVLISSDYYELGYSSDDWENSAFKEYTGTLLLSNK